MKKGVLIFFSIICFLGCSDGKYESGESVAELAISFLDPQWDGKRVPPIGQCTNCGSQGFSPPLMVTNIPARTDALIIEFKDKTMPTDHGAIRFNISQQTEFSIPSFPEQTYDLPQGAEMETEHNAPIGKPGVYMAPCGCGWNNKYVATIVAIKSETSGERILLGKGKIKLGRF